MSETPSVAKDGIAAVLGQAWRRRWWRPDPAAMACYENLKPMVIVTGASQGIGLALARRFAAADHDLLMIARTPEPLRAAASEISEHYRVRAAPLALDVTDPEAPAAIDRALEAAGCYADVLVNCAGVGLAGSFTTHEPADIRRMAELNVVALTTLTRHFLPGMCIRGRGGVLSLASLGGYVPGPNQAAYYASKAYVISLTEALARECRGLGVRVTVVSPGPVATDFHSKMRGDTALYLRLLPVAAPGRIADIAYRSFRLGLVSVVPGLLPPAMMVALRVLPHWVTVPLVEQLLKPRNFSGRRQT
jgi:short-subunit dehydrogenase